MGRHFQLVSHGFDTDSFMIFGCNTTHSHQLIWHYLLIMSLGLIPKFIVLSLIQENQLIKPKYN
jgi:hypothetical protein